MFPGILPSFTSLYQNLGQPTKLNRKAFAPHSLCFLALFSAWLSYLGCPPRSTEVPDLLFLSEGITSVSHFAPAWLPKRWWPGHCSMGHHPPWAQPAAQLCLPPTANTLQAGGRFRRVSVPTFSVESKKESEAYFIQKVPNCRTDLTVTCSPWRSVLTQAKRASFPQRTEHISQLQDWIRAQASTQISIMLISSAIH